MNQSVPGHRPGFFFFFIASTSGGCFWEPLEEWKATSDVVVDSTFVTKSLYESELSHFLGSHLKMRTELFRRNLAIICIKNP